MPAVSKQQQKFFGIVRAIQKGDAPASKFSKSAQKAAKTMKKKDVKDFADTDRKGLPKKVQKEERDYKAEYKKFQSSDKAKKYRAELNQYNRKRGTYGNGDGKDASHKGGKIAGFEEESTNRGRAEKSRLKKEIRRMVKEELSEVYRTPDELGVVMRYRIDELSAALKKAEKGRLGPEGWAEKYFRSAPKAIEMIERLIGILRKT